MWGPGTSLSDIKFILAIEGGTSHDVLDVIKLPVKTAESAANVFTEQEGAVTSIVPFTCLHKFGNHQQAGAKQHQLDHQRLDLRQQSQH